MISIFQITFDFGSISHGCGIESFPGLALAGQAGITGRPGPPCIYVREAPRAHPLPSMLMIPRAPLVCCGWWVPLFSPMFQFAFGWFHACRSDRIGSLRSIGTPRSIGSVGSIGAGRAIRSFKSVGAVGFVRSIGPLDWSDRSDRSHRSDRSVGSDRSDFFSPMVFQGLRVGA